MIGLPSYGFLLHSCVEYINGHDPAFPLFVFALSDGPVAIEVIPLRTDAAHLAMISITVARALLCGAR